MLCGWEGLTLHWPCEINDSDMPIYGLTAFEQVLHFSNEYRPLYRCTSDCIRGLHGVMEYPTTPSVPTLFILNPIPNPCSIIQPVCNLLL